MFKAVEASPQERREPRPGDDLVSPADVVMDRAFTVPGSPQSVWPWLLQLGKRRAGWYLPRTLERFVPPGRRALRRVDPAWLSLRVGDVIPDYGGSKATFEVAAIDPPASIVYRSERGRVQLTWSISLATSAGDPTGATRVYLRLRLAPVRRIWLAESAGEFVDRLTVAGMAAGLRERLADQLE